MPELPEVEVTRRALAPYVEGLDVRAVRIRDRRLRWPIPARLGATLAGRRLLKLDRRGKYLLWRFEHGTLISHLGMSGSWRLYLEAPPPARPHEHADIEFLGRDMTPRTARLTDPRRFGALLWHPLARGRIEAHPLLAHLGREPFDEGFDAATLHAASRGRRISVKQLLLGGQVVVGVGNIYASESLFRAGIHPGLPAARLTRAQCERLVQAVRAVLAAAIEAGGSTLRNFIGADGSAGYFTLVAMVYERAGQPCRTCSTPIGRLVQGARATYFCPVCQRR